MSLITTVYGGTDEMRKKFKEQNRIEEIELQKKLYELENRMIQAELRQSQYNQKKSWNACGPYLENLERVKVRKEELEQSLKFTTFEKYVLHKQHIHQQLKKKHRE